MRAEINRRNRPRCPNSALRHINARCAKRGRILLRVDVRHLAPADPGWRAVFDDDSLVRIVAWAIDDQGVLGLIVDPNDPAQIVAAPQATTPDGFTFARYGFRADS